MGLSANDNVSWHRATRPIAYSIILLFAMVLAVVYKFRIESIFACPASGYGQDAYLSDCHARTYGDYDHGAFWFGLEPEALRAAADADVLFLGSSRLQFGFSTPSIDAWSSRLGVRYYLLGFSHTETTNFVSPLLSEIRPRARVYVINVDRFFDDRVTAPAGAVLATSDAVDKYRTKQSWQFVHKSVCSHFPVVCGSSLGVFRVRSTGAWRRAGVAPFNAEDVSNGVAVDVQRWAQFADLGRKFLAELPVDRSCVVFTLVPTVATRRDEAKAIAEQLGLELVAPQLDGLRTFDGSHLDEHSAQRWSAAFFEEAGPRIRDCLARSQGPAS